MPDKAILIIMAIIACAATMPCAACSDSVSGMSDLTNSSITWSGVSASVLTDVLDDNTVDFVGVNGYEFIWVHDNALKLNETIGSDLYTLTPDVAMTIWYVLIDDAHDQVIVRTHTDFSANPVFSLVSFGTFYGTVFGVVAYTIVLAVPVSVYLYNRSVGMFIVLCLLMGGAGAGMALTMEPALMPYIILPIGLGIGVLLYTVFWPGRDDEN